MKKIRFYFLFLLYQAAMNPILRFLGTALLGQAISILISFTGVFTTFLVRNNASYPLLQSLSSYLVLFIVYTPLLIYNYYKHRTTTFTNFRFFQRPWKYIILGVVDLEANYLVIMAYEYTDIMSVQLLSCLSTPCVLIFSIIILRSSLGLTHAVGSCLAISGAIFLILKDTNEPSENANSRIVGDLLCIASSILYALSNVLVECFIKPQAIIDPDSNAFLDNEEPVTDVIDAREDTEGSIATVSCEEVLVPHYIPIIENIAFLSLWGLIFSTVQFFAIEWKNLRPNRSDWTAEDWRNQVLFSINMGLIYTLLPILFFLCSAGFANLSLLTINIYGILWNVIFFNSYPPMWFLLIPVLLIMLGIVVFNVTELFPYEAIRRIDRPWATKNDSTELTENDV